MIVMCCCFCFLSYSSERKSTFFSSSAHMFSYTHPTKFRCENFAMIRSRYRHPFHLPIGIISTMVIREWAEKWEEIIKSIDSEKDIFKGLQECWISSLISSQRRCFVQSSVSISFASSSFCFSVISANVNSTCSLNRFNETYTALPIWCEWALVSKKKRSLQSVKWLLEHASFDKNNLKQLQQNLMILHQKPPIISYVRPS